MKDNLGDRMKKFYEDAFRYHLPRRMPVIIRIDGKAFHSFTRGFPKPYDIKLMTAMAETMLFLCQNIQGTVFGYTQSDEISLCLVDYKKLNSDAYFDNNVQKISSVVASMTTMFFNKTFSSMLEETDVRQKRVAGTAMFDARCFVLPREEVANYFYWRQLDASRNSVNMLGRCYFTQKELHGKNISQVQDMLVLSKGINWNDEKTAFKRGSACIKNDTKWEIDWEMPILRGEDRQYVEKWLEPDPE